MTMLSPAGGAAAPRRSDAPSRHWWPWPLVLIVCDLGLVLARAASYQAFFSMSGALGYLLEAVVALAVYACGLGALPVLVARAPSAASALRVGTVAGLVGGAIEIISTALESLWGLPQQVVTIVTGGAMVTLFLSFGMAGFLGGRLGGTFWHGLGAAVWSAVVAVPLVVTFGFLLVIAALPQLAHGAIGDPDYVRSGWTDVRAFAIANAFDAGFTHLVEAPVIAAVLGTLGSAAGRMAQDRARRRSPQPVQSEEKR